MCLVLFCFVLNGLLNALDVALVIVSRVLWPMHRIF